MTPQTIVTYALVIVLDERYFLWCLAAWPMRERLDAHYALWTRARVQQLDMWESEGVAG